MATRHALHTDNSLFHWAAFKGMPDVLVFPLCRSFFQQLVVAVDFCHSMGIPVRDLRPHNLLLLEPNDAPSLCRCVHMPNLHAHVSTEPAYIAVSYPASQAL